MRVHGARAAGASLGQPGGPTAGFKGGRVGSWRESVSFVLEDSGKIWRQVGTQRLSRHWHFGGAAWGARQDTALELPELTPEEKRVLERKLKKERRKEERKQLRKDAAPSVPAKPSGAQLALDYLRSWAQKHEEWKFQKTRQTWLLLHMYDDDQVPDELFSTLLAYLEGLRGRARELTVQKAEALMQKSDEARGADTLPLGTIQRVRQVLQLLS
ncbi:uncharacterized protein C7orf50 homolog isoform X2 [Lynx rufus]|uniref:uncharacterized protein C7orf50 homolog isoform X2 n=1 Tax=Lynx rufus TaxID=61384 RepID=UPI001F128594|nr:uncharacterized protein C7orf50 homolog isoform X2 [Lynx rufus]